MKIATTLLIGFVLAGCAGKQAAVYNPQKSEAYNVMAAAIGEYDVERFLPDSAPPEQAGDNTTSTLATGAAAYAAHSMPLSGLSLTDVGVGVLSAMTAPDEDAKVKSNSIIAWMPKSLAANNKEAQRKILNIMTSATIETLKKNGFAINGVKRTQEAWSFKAHDIYGLCENAEKNEILASNWTKTPYEGSSPLWLNGQDAWVLSHQSDSNIDVIKCVADKEHLFESLSSKLPKWFYIYRASTEKTPPVVYHQGKALYFVAPKAQTKNDGE